MRTPPHEPQPPAEPAAPPGAGAAGAQPAPAPAAAPPPTLRQRLSRYHRHTRGAFTGFLMGFPLALAYYACVLGGIEPDARDAFISFQISVVGETAYALIQAGLALVFLVLVLVLQRKHRFEARYFVPLVFESLVYGALAVAAVTAALHAFDLEPLFPPPDNRWFALASALGEATNEETFFRWVALEVLVWLLHRRAQLRRLVALPIALAFATLVYALVLTFGIQAPSPEWSVLARFATLLVAGTFFGILYLARGYTVAAYTHVFYAVFWLGIHPVLV